eukprot:c3450_g1_i1.p1 GENE.c3450_g1_i1~~c3450_g1_i1.p1  ORF type:complete len:526 (-),score=108.25 c3450_g1_i1:1-1578(-)
MHTLDSHSHDLPMFVSSLPHDAQGFAHVQSRLFGLAGILVGLLPQTQPHSFVSVGIIILTVAIIQTVQLLWTRSWKHRFTIHAVQNWITFGILAFALGIPQLLPFVHRVSHGSGFVRFATAWDEEKKGENPLVLWWRALGLFVPLCLIGYLKQTTPQQRHFYIAFWILFGVCNVVMFQPWHLDNTKLLYVWVFGASAYVSNVLEHLMNHPIVFVPPTKWVISKDSRRMYELVQRRTCQFIVCVITLSLMWSGILACWRELFNHATEFRVPELELSEYIKANTPPDAIFLHDINSSPRHIRAESSLAGRAILYGYEGWLSSHGLHYTTRRDHIKSIMKGKSNAISLLRQYNISYIVIDWLNRDNFDWNFVNSIGDPVATNGKHVLYRVMDEVFEKGNLTVRDCGHYGVTKQGCEGKSCWWFENFNGPWCQYPIVQRDVFDCAQNITTSKTHCQDILKCLWFEKFPGPYCQKPLWQLQHPSIPVMKYWNLPTPNADCGWHGISDTQCVMRGCKWIPNNGNNPWCVHQ